MENRRKTDGEKGINKESMIHWAPEPKASAVTAKIVTLNDKLAYHIIYCHDYCSIMGASFGVRSYLFFSCPHFPLSTASLRWRLPVQQIIKKKARGSERSEQKLLDLTFSVSPIDRALIKYLASNSDKQNKPPDRLWNQKQQQAQRIQIRSNRGVEVNGN